MTKKRIWIYIILSFLPIYVGTLFNGLCGNSYASEPTQTMLAFFMLAPAVAVFLTVKLTKEDVHLTGEKSLNLGLSFKGKKKWWFLLAIFTPVLYVELGYVFYYLLFSKAYDLNALDVVAKALGIKQELLWIVPFYYVVNSIMFSICALGEEIGWRAYLYPKLEEVMGEGKALIVGGIIWSVWHFPMLYIGHNFGTDYWGAPWMGFLVFTIYCVALGSIFYFFTKKTKSVWTSAFMHAIHNTVASVSLLRVIMTREGVPAWAKESTAEILLVSVPSILLGGLLIAMSFYKNKKSKTHLDFVPAK